MEKKFYLLLDSSVLFNDMFASILFSLPASLKKDWEIVVPQAVVDEIGSRADYHLLQNFSKTQTSQAKKRKKQIIKAIKIWPKLVKKLKYGDWIIKENYQRGIQNYVRIEAQKNNLHLSGADLRILSTALYLRRNGGGVPRNIILLTLDKELTILAKREGIKVPDFLFDFV
jgi:predicted ribonuclease YlaK